eukprot:COSAG03_NODE_8786_length_771_cov_4.061012_1_plen_113_part_00
MQGPSPSLASISRGCSQVGTLFDVVMSGSLGALSLLLLAAGSGATTPALGQCVFEAAGRGCTQLSWDLAGLAAAVPSPGVLRLNDRCVCVHARVRVCAQVRENHPKQRRRWR